MLLCAHHTWKCSQVADQLTRNACSSTARLSSRFPILLADPIAWLKSPVVQPAADDLNRGSENACMAQSKKRSSFKTPSGLRLLVRSCTRRRNRRVFAKTTKLRKPLETQKCSVLPDFIDYAAVVNVCSPALFSPVARARPRVEIWTFARGARDPVLRFICGRKTKHKQP